MTIRNLIVVALALLVVGCETYMAPRYGISADNVVALKSLAPGQIKVGAFTDPKQFGDGCRAAGPIKVGDGLTFAGYIRKALIDEMKIAGVYNENGNVTLTGSVDNLAFSSTVAFWDIGLTVTSSNGKSVSVQEHYQFPGAFAAVTACKRVSDGYYPAVQNLLQKLIASPDFRALVNPG
jgi:hypothetical protein